MPVCFTANLSNGREIRSIVGLVLSYILILWNCRHCNSYVWYQSPSPCTWTQIDGADIPTDADRVDIKSCWSLTGNENAAFTHLTKVTQI